MKNMITFFFNQPNHEEVVLPSSSYMANSDFHYPKVMNIELDHDHLLDKKVNFDDYDYDERVVMKM